MPSLALHQCSLTGAGLLCWQGAHSCIDPTPPPHPAVCLCPCAGARLNKECSLPWISLCQAGCACLASTRTGRAGSKGMWCFYAASSALNAFLTEWGVPRATAAYTPANSPHTGRIPASLLAELLWWAHKRACMPRCMHWIARWAGTKGACAHSRAPVCIFVAVVPTHTTKLARQNILSYS